MVCHTFTGVFKVQDTAQAATHRPIMSVKVSLPAPVVLTAGVYWLQWSLTGSLTSGPWCPPVATLNQGVTGNAEQKAGAIAQTATGCGATGITVGGAPNVGGFIRTTLSGATNIGIIGYGFTNLPVPFCGCTVAHRWEVTEVGTVSVIAVPANASLCGIALGVQGLDFGATGGCPLGFTLTNGFQFTLNN